MLPPFLAHGLGELAPLVDLRGGHGDILPPSNGWELAGAMDRHLLVIALVSPSARRAVDPRGSRSAGRTSCALLAGAPVRPNEVLS